MPQPYHGFLYLSSPRGPRELINHARTLEYLSTATLGCGIRVETPGCSPCDAYAHDYDCDLEQWIPVGYSTPEIDEAPWYGENWEGSEDVVGMWIEEWTGLDSGHLRRTSTSVGGAASGYRASALGAGERIMQLNVMLIAANERGLQHLFDWLEATLLGCSSCGDSSIYIRRYCADDPADGLVELRNVSLREGLTWISVPEAMGNQSVRRVTFTLAAADPCMYALDVSVPVTKVVDADPGSCLAGGVLPGSDLAPYLTFTNTSDYGQIADGTSVELSGDSSIAARIFVTSPFSGNRIIASKHFGGGNGSYEFQLRSDGRLLFRFSNDGTNWIDVFSTEALPPFTDKWFSVGVSIDADVGAGQWRCDFFYSLDHVTWVKLGNDVMPGFPQTASIYNSTSPLFISGWLAGSLAGKLSHLRIAKMYSPSTPADGTATFDLRPEDMEGAASAAATTLTVTSGQTLSLTGQPGVLSGVTEGGLVLAANRSPCRPRCGELNDFCREIWAFDADLLGGTAPIVTLRNTDGEATLPVRVVVYADRLGVGIDDGPCGLSILGEIYVRPLPEATRLRWDVVAREVLMRSGSTPGWTSGYPLVDPNDLGVPRFFSTGCGTIYVSVEIASACMEDLGAGAYSYDSYVFNDPHYPSVAVEVGERLGCPA